MVSFLLFMASIQTCTINPSLFRIYEKLLYCIIMMSKAQIENLSKCNKIHWHENCTMLPIHIINMPYIDTYNLSPCPRAPGAGARRWRYPRPHSHPAAGGHREGGGGAHQRAVWLDRWHQHWRSAGSRHWCGCVHGKFVLNFLTSQIFCTRYISKNKLLL